MRRVPTSFLQPGMEVAHPVFTNDGVVLLSKGVKLTEEYIRRLVKREIPFLYISDSISEDVNINDVISEGLRVEANKHVKDIINKVVNKNNDFIDLARLKSIVSEIVSQLLSNRNMLYDLVDIRSVDDYLYSHSVNVCVLAVMTGVSLGYRQDRLEELAVGALLHDVGKSLVPLNVLNKPGRLTSEEFEEIKKHPDYSLQILRKKSGISSVSRVIAYQHHERYNGDGYPRGIKKDDFLEPAQIVGMVDIYDAITSDRVYKKALPAFEAYEMLSGAGDHYFRFDIVKKFLSQVAVYPSGSLVRLSTGQIGIVVENKKSYPLSPKVRIILEPDGTMLKPMRVIDLCEVLNVVIHEVISEEETRNVLYNIKKQAG
ncbi:MAG: HD-GYP domain-containing protein [Bacillota bacterium]